MDSLDEYSTTISSDSGYEDSSEDYTLDTYTYAGVNTLLSSNKFDASESGSNEEPLKTLNCTQQNAEKAMMVAGSDDDDDEDDNTSVEEDDVFLDAKAAVPTMNKVVPVSSLRKVVEITPLSCAMHDKQRREEEEAARQAQIIAGQRVNGDDEDFEPVTIVQEFPKMSAPISLASKGMVPLTAYSSQEIAAFKLEQDAKDLSAMKEARAKPTTLDDKQCAPLNTYSAKKLETLKATQDLFVSLDNYSAKEIAGFKLAQDARATKQTTLKSANDTHCTPANKSESVTASQDKQYTNISRKTLSKQSNTSFVSLDDYSAKEVAAFKLEQDARHGVKTSTPSSTGSLKSTFATASIQKVQRAVPPTLASAVKDDEATPLSTLSAKALRELELSKKTMIYSLKNVSGLSAAKKEEFYAQQQQQQQKPVFQSDRIRTVLKSPQKIVPLSHPHFNDPFARVCVDELSLEQLRELVRECRAHHDSADRMPQKKTVLSKSATPTLSMPLSKRLYSPQVKQCIKSDSIVLNSLPERELLCNINSLPLETRTSILSSLKSEADDKPIVFQNHSTLSSKKAYELKLSSSLFKSNPKVLSLYHGLSTKNKSALELDCPCPQVTESPKMSSDVFDYMTSEYPLYSQLLKKNINRRLLNELSERNVMFLVPGRALMAILRQQGEMMKALAYLTMLMSKGESIPVGSDHYAVNTLVKNSPITIRRIDDETLEVDSSMIAKLDPTSEGRVYMMIEPSIEDLDTETAATIIASEEKAEADAKAEESVTTVAEQVGESESELEASELDNEEEPEEEMVDETVEEPITSTTTTTTTTTTSSQPIRRSSPTIQVNVGAEPTVIRTLPADEELAIVKVEEQSPVASDANALVLTGVFKNTQYKNRKFETLATKMVEKGYNGQVDMANYISQTNSCAPQLFLKTFSYDTLYDKYRSTATAMSGLERLTPVASFSIEHKNNLNYELDSKLKMKEFIVDSQKMNITKRQLIDHFNVLCFKTKANNQYAVASFTLPDVNTDTFMSADENLLLKFQDNLLHSVTINTNGANFMLTTLAAQKNAFLGKDSNVMKHINAQVSLDSAKTYTKDLSYAQFVSTMLAATKPSWFQRVKAGFRQVTGSEVIQLRTLEADEIETFNRSISTATVKMDDLSRRREALVNVPVSIAKGVVGVVRGSMFVNFNRAELVSTDGQIRLRYQYNPGSDKGVQQQPILFEKLLWGSNSSAQDQPRLTLEIPSPLKRGNPEQVFRFHISVPGRSIPQGTVYYYGAAREKEGDIRFTFVVKDGVLTEIYIVAKPVNTYNTRISPFDKNIAKFLATESYAFKKHGLDLPYSYMNSRFSKYLVKSGLTKDKLDTLRYREYFSTLNKEIKTFMVKHKLDALLTDAPKDSVLTLVTANILHTTNYQSPLVEESKRYQSLLLSGFSPLSVNATTTTSTTTNTAPQVLKLAIREYKTLSGTSKLRNQPFALYMDRFLHITSTMANASWL